MDRTHVMELVRSHQVGELSRREFLARAAVALGSVTLANTVLAACMPVTGPTAPVVVATLDFGFWILDFGFWIGFDFGLSFGLMGGFERFRKLNFIKCPTWCIIPSS